MRKQIGVLREDRDGGYVRQMCTFWTELGWEVICPPPHSAKNPLVPLWCGVHPQQADVCLRVKKGKICHQDLKRLHEIMGESRRKLYLAAQKAARGEKGVAGKRKY